MRLFPVLLQKSEILQMEKLSGSEVYILTDATGREVLRGSQLTASDLEKNTGRSVYPEIEKGRWKAGK